MILVIYNVSININDFIFYGVFIIYVIYSLNANYFNRKILNNLDKIITIPIMVIFKYVLS